MHGRMPHSRGFSRSSINDDILLVAARRVLGQHLLFKRDAVNARGLQKENDIRNLL